MTTLNHERPQLRYLDNLKRELNKSLSQASTGKGGPSPGYFRQIEARPKALASLGRLFEALEDWLSDDSRPLSLSTPPQSIKDAYAAFCAAKVQHDYDPAYNGRDWLNAGVGQARPGSDDFREGLLLLLKHA